MTTTDTRPLAVRLRAGNEVNAVDDVERWFAAHDAYHKASDAYNARLKIVQAERERDNWSFNVHAEYAALNDAQRTALKADATLYAALAATRTTATPLRAGRGIGGGNG